VEVLETRPAPEDQVDDVPASDRERARKRLQDRREFGSHAVAFVVVNAFLIGAWAITGGGYFWPAWILAAWGVGLVLHGWDTFVRKPITEADIDRELQRQRGDSTHS
jgi:hypothetical protein